MSPSFETVRVAAVQATPVVLDAEASVEKACRLLGEAADQGARLAVLPEAFVPLYPSGAWAHDAGSFSGWGRLWQRLWENSIDVPGPLCERIAERCRELDLYCAIGVNEREAERPGSLYNTLLLLGPDGLLHKHRKLMPTMHERLFHGIGAGDDLAVTETQIGRIGGLICWENRMPLARYALYRGGPQIWVAPTADDSDGWLASMRHIAIESGAYVVSVPQYIPAAPAVIWRIFISSHKAQVTKHNTQKNRTRRAKSQLVNHKSGIRVALFERPASGTETPRCCLHGVAAS